MVGVGSTAICVASDAAHVIERLQPWQIESSSRGDIGFTTVNYGLELASAASTKAAATPLSRLFYGSSPLLTSRDDEQLLTVLLEILSAHSYITELPVVRLGLGAVASAHRTVLAPIEFVTSLSERWLEHQGLRRLTVTSTVVDTSVLQIRSEAPLGSAQAVEQRALTAWILPAPLHQSTWSPAQAVAQAMGSAIDVSLATASETLRAVARLVDHVRPEPLQSEPSGQRAQLLDLLELDDR